MQILQVLIISAMCAAHSWAAPLAVCTTTTDLGDITRQVGGEHVKVTVFVKGRDNPHFLEARPSFIKSMSKADLFVQIGLELEIGWVPAILASCRNGKVQSGQPGNLDVGRLVRPKYAATEAVDRGHGDVHAGGSPHYMLDPVYGMRVAELIAARLGELRPSAKSDFAANLKRFNGDIGRRLVGERLAAKYDPLKLALLYEHGRLTDFLKETGEVDPVGGWIGSMQASAGKFVIVDHDEYRYLLDRFRIKQIGELEPKPGIQPSTRHLRKMITACEKQKCACILATVYFPPKHAELVSRKCGVPVIQMAHQSGSRAEAASYVEMLDNNIAQLRKGTR